MNSSAGGKIALTLFGVVLLFTSLIFCGLWANGAQGLNWLALLSFFAAVVILPMSSNALLKALTGNSRGSLPTPEDPRVQELRAKMDRDFKIEDEAARLRFIDTPTSDPGWRGKEHLFDFRLQQERESQAQSWDANDKKK
ncbi:MAG: hypothetical protein ACYDER_01265 [Ktedonobacteraceae bacterium]